MAKRLDVDMSIAPQSRLSTAVWHAMLVTAATLIGMWLAGLASVGLDTLSRLRWFVWANSALSIVIVLLGVVHWLVTPRLPPIPGDDDTGGAP